MAGVCFNPSTSHTGSSAQNDDDGNNRIAPEANVTRKEINRQNINTDRMKQNQFETILEVIFCSFHFDRSLEIYLI